MYIIYIAAFDLALSQRTRDEHVKNLWKQDLQVHSDSEFISFIDQSFNALTIYIGRDLYFMFPLRCTVYWYIHRFAGSLFLSLINRSMN